MNAKVHQLVGKVKLGAKKNAPELLLGLGLVTGTATVVMASKATIKAVEINKGHKCRMEVLEESRETGSMDDAELKAQVISLYKGYALDLAKTYAVPVGLYAATVVSVFASYKIQKNRQIALSAALAACTTAYTTLLGKIKNGAANGLTAKEVLDGVEVKENIDPVTGEVTIEKVQGTPVEELYTFRFDDQNAAAWEKDKFQNECTLRAEESWANDMLRLQGYVFLNDVLKRLGIEPTQAGQIVGWRSNGDGDGYIDFGMKDLGCYENEDGNPCYYRENAFELNFNVDGDILTNFPRK